VLLSCSYFRNELGGEPLKLVCLSRASSSSNQSSPAHYGAHQQQEGVLAPDDERQTQLRPPTAAEAAILENLSNVYLGGRLCAARQDPLVFEYVDQGAFYYRHCFAGKGKKYTVYAMIFFEKNLSWLRIVFISRVLEFSMFV